MNLSKGLWMVGVFFLCIASQRTETCTAFAVEQGDFRFFAKNLDWPVGHGAVLLNPRGLEKDSYFPNPGQKSIRWQSQYASITFNQAGVEFPYGGMNEKGLSVEVLLLPSSQYPEIAPTTPSVNESQWIQYILDTSSSLSEAILRAQRTDVVKEFAPVHYLVCDTVNNCATFEYLRGQLNVHAGAELPVKVLTNDTYEDSLAFLKNYQGFGGTEALPQDDGSLSRFVRAASFAKDFQAKSVEDARSQIFEALANTASFSTQWQLVYDKKNKEITFHTLMVAAMEIHSICTRTQPGLYFWCEGRGYVERFKRG